MGILSGIFKSRDAPSNRTSGSAYSFFMGSSSSGKRVNERSAMQMTAVSLSYKFQKKIQAKACKKKNSQSAAECIQIQ